MLGWAHTEQTQSTTSQAVHLPPFEKGEKTERPPEEGLENKGIRGALTVANDLLVLTQVHFDSLFTTKRPLRSIHAKIIYSSSYHL